MAPQLATVLGCEVRSGDQVGGGGLGAGQPRKIKEYLPYERVSHDESADSDMANER
jgi:hypothetical protein